MKKTNNLLLSALKASIRDEKAVRTQPLSQEEWLALFRLAELQKVLPLVYGAVYDQPGADPAVMTRYKTAVRQQIALQVMKTAEFEVLYRCLTAAGLRPLVVKGLVCRELYPHPDERISGDEDILIPPEQFDTAHRVMLAFGMEPEAPEAEFHNLSVISYRKENSPLHIELHKYLFSPGEDALEGLNGYFSDLHEKAMPIPERETPMWMPDVTEHLFFLICHAFKHFIHSGFGIRQVCDICLFAERWGGQIHWETVLANCKAIRGDVFAAALFAIGEKHLGILKPSIWPDVDELAMLEDLLSGSVFGAADLTRQHSSTITLNAVAAGKKGKRSSFLQSAFPPAAKLAGRYPYLREYPALLPVAWADRLLKYRAETRRTAGNDTAKTLEIGRQRVALLKQYGIIP